MCELMGLSFDRPVLAQISMKAFASRDVENPDGWGLAWYPDRSVAVAKEARTWRESGFTRFLEGYAAIKARIYVAHVRRQTTGDSTRADTHPFCREYLGRDFCFAHNGTIQNYGSLPVDRYHPVGRTDSERLFCHLLSRMHDRGERLAEPESWAWLGRTLLETNQHGTMNCILSDGARLFVYRDLHGWKGLAMRRVRFREGSEQFFEDATTEISVEGDAHNQGCVVATRPLTRSGWTELTHGQLLVFEGRALRFESEV